MDLIDKLRILTESAKYDVACTSSGVDRGNKPGQLGNAVASGICHSFAADGRCISLLKVLMTNYCVYDCKYCVNRRSNDIERVAFEPHELAELTIEFYRRNYIEGLFLSSGVIKNPDHAMERMCIAISMLRNKYQFNGYIHAKAIPGASQEVIAQLGLLVDRMSVNIELPSESSLKLFAPDKHKQNILLPMQTIKNRIAENSQSLSLYKKPQRFAPAGQSTQMIIGASPETDFHILRLSDSLYKKFSLKRVFYSAYMPVSDFALLPQNVKPQLLREHRLYQADWLLRVYGFDTTEILNEQHPWLDPLLDPKCNWAMNHLDLFPIEVNKADYQMLLRVPGIGVTGARKIVKARRAGQLTFEELKKLNIVLKRAQHFITCSGRYMSGMKFDHDFIYNRLTAGTVSNSGMDIEECKQLSLFEDQPKLLPMQEDVQKCLTGQI